MLRVFAEESELPALGNQFLERSDNVGAVAKVVVEQLSRDLRAGRIPVFYQPQVDEFGGVCGVEALLRWRFRGKPLPPPLVIKLAREAGIYGDLTDCILDTAVADSARFRNALGRPLMVSVNISPYESARRFAWLRRPGSKTASAWR